MTRPDSQTTTEYLLEALRDIANPMRIFEREAHYEEKSIDGHAAMVLSNDPNFLKDIARGALAKADI